MSRRMAARPENETLARHYSCNRPDDANVIVESVLACGDAMTCRNALEIFRGSVCLMGIK